MNVLLRIALLAGLASSAHAQSWGDSFKLGDPIAAPSSSSQNGGFQNGFHSESRLWGAGATTGSSLRLDQTVSFGLFSSFSSGAFGFGAMPLAAPFPLASLNGPALGLGNPVTTAIGQNALTSGNGWDASTFGGRLSMDIGHGLTMDFIGGLTRATGNGPYVDPRGSLYMSPGGTLTSSVGAGLSMDLGGGASLGFSGNVSHTSGNGYPMGGCAMAGGLCR